MQSCDFLEIPFRLTLSHGAKAGRISSDSIVLRVGAGRPRGISARPSCGSTFPAHSARARRSKRSGSDRGGAAGAAEGARPHLAEAAANSRRCSLRAVGAAAPVRRGIRRARLRGLEAREREPSADPYAVLGLEPVRDAVVYGGVLPFVPLEAAREIRRHMRQAEADQPEGEGRNGHRVQRRDPRPVPGDCWATGSICAWTRTRPGAPADAEQHLRGVRAATACASIEQPFPVSESRAAWRAAFRGGDFRSWPTKECLPLRTFARSPHRAAPRCSTFGSPRTAASGACSRWRRRPTPAACPTSLGAWWERRACSPAMGRLAASLLPRPLYIEGSYDEILLEAEHRHPELRFRPRRTGAALPGQRHGIPCRHGALSKFSRARLPV